MCNCKNICDANCIKKSNKELYKHFYNKPIDSTLIHNSFYDVYMTSCNYFKLKHNKCLDYSFNYFKNIEDWKFSFSFVINELTPCNFI